MSFLSRPPPVFLPNRPKIASFLLSVRFLKPVLARLSVDGVYLTEFSEITLFRVKNSKMTRVTHFNRALLQGKPAGIIGRGMRKRQALK